MRTFNIQDAKKQLSRLVDQAAKGESFVIAKAGKPMVKVIAFTGTEHMQKKRFGFLSGQASVPDDFDQMGEGDIEQLFEDRA